MLSVVTRARRFPLRCNSVSNGVKATKTYTYSYRRLEKNGIWYYFQSVNYHFGHGDNYWVLFLYISDKTKQCKPTSRYNDVIMTTMASQITNLTVVYSTVYSDADKRKHQSSASLAFVWGIHRDRWIPRTKGQLRGKCFHLMTSSCLVETCRDIIFVLSPRSHFYISFRDKWERKISHKTNQQKRLCKHYDSSLNSPNSAWFEIT